ncbi:MAG: hypothetical protein ACI91F_000940 [Candidatus Binatia bacterium]|jgi:hypothetical protein
MVMVGTTGLVVFPRRNRDVDAVELGYRAEELLEVLLGRDLRSFILVGEGAEDLPRRKSTNPVGPRLNKFP